MNLTKVTKKRYILWGLAAAGLSMCAVLICFAALRVYPFGNYSVLTNDAYIQYADYFRYLKEVMNGNASIAYSFSKSLGGSLIALFGYYLSSPFNLLLYFFKIDQIESFVLVITILKVGLCGFTFCLFIRSRLKDIRPVFAVAASLAYAFTQYNVGQLSNISWLDGVYILPVILWAIWRYVSENKKGMLYASIALSIIFNWYTGYMNCLFAVIYFLYEQIMWNYAHENLTLKKTFFQFVRFCFVELLGVMLSCAFFIPVVLGQSGGRSILDEGIFDFGTNGSFINIFRGFMIGTPNMGLTVSDPTITLFCGVFVLICCIYFFCHKDIKPYQKIGGGALIGVMVLSQFIQPLEHIWCGFKFANAFQFRFAYITIFTIIFVAAQAMEKFFEFDVRKFAKICFLCIGVFLIFDAIKPYGSITLWIQTGLLVFYALAVWFVFRYSKCRRVGLALLGMVFYFEILANGYWVASDVYRKPAGEYAAYSEAQARLVEKIKSYDNAPFYRIEQNENRDKKRSDSSFFANESLAYGYSGIQQYSSSYDKNTADFIAALGYCKGYFPTFYNQPILSSDSLLGIKYLMSTEEYYGMEKVRKIGEENGKSVYVNPYALSLGFGVDAGVLDQIGLGSQFDISTITTDNPFEFQNKVYSAILGKAVEIYEPVKAVYHYDVDSENAVYELEGVRADDIVYGYTRSVLDAVPMYINNKFVCYYRNAWGNMGVYPISVSQEDREVCFKTKGYDADQKTEWLRKMREAEAGYSEDAPDALWIESVYYKFNPDVFKEAIAAIQSDSIEVETIRDGYVRGTYTSDKDGWLMFTIAADDGWKASVNGETVQIEEGVNTFVTIPVKAGSNSIELSYTLKGEKAGWIISILSVLIFVIWLSVEKHRKKNR